MAGIKSTMDLVMERAARMGMATPDEMRHEESLKKGMQSTADYLNGTKASLARHPRRVRAVRTGLCPQGHAGLAPAQPFSAP